MRIGLALKGALGEDGWPLFAAWSAPLTARTRRSSRSRPGPASSPSGSAPAHLSPRAGRRLNPVPALLLNAVILVNGRHPAGPYSSASPRVVGRRPARSTAAAPAHAGDPRILELDGASELFVDYILASAVGRSRSSRSAPACARWARSWAAGSGPRPTSGPTSTSSAWRLAAAAGPRRGCIKEALIAAGLQRYLGGNRIASGSGLLTALYRQPSSLFQLDEFGQFMRNIVNKRHAPKYLAEIWDLLTQLAPAPAAPSSAPSTPTRSSGPGRASLSPAAACTRPPCRSRSGPPSRRLDARRQPRPVPGLPDRRGRARSQQAAEGGRRPVRLIEALQAIVAGVPGHARGNIAALAEGR